MHSNIRYTAGDRIVKNIFTTFNNIENPEHIQNRVIVLEELFSTNIRRFKGDSGIDAICKILLDKSNELSNLQNKSVEEEISKIIDSILKEYRRQTGKINEKTGTLDDRGCQSFLTKYLFWSAYAEMESYHDNFYIFDNVVKRKIKFRHSLTETGFYIKWHEAMSKAKTERGGNKNNRDIDSELWDEQKELESNNKKVQELQKKADKLKKEEEDELEKNAKM